MLVESLMHRAKIDPTLPWHRQDVTKLGQVYTTVSNGSRVLYSYYLTLSQARQKASYFCRFAADWATAEMVKMKCKNKRNYLKHLATRSSSSSDNTDREHTTTSESGSGDEGGDGNGEI